MIKDLVIKKYPNVDISGLDEYIQFIESRNIPNIEEYGENHHILPVCLFKEYKSKKNFPWNIKRLKPEDHFIAHYLLHRLLPGKLSHAWTAMWINENRNNPREFSEIFLKDYSEEYAIARSNRTTSDEVKAKISASCRGLKKSEETKNRMKEAWKSRVYSEEIIQKLRDSVTDRNKKRTVSKETKEKMSKAKKGKPNGKLGSKQSEETRAKISNWARQPRKKNRIQT